MTSLSEIRSTYIDFFKSREHAEVASSSLVPHNDPTLMFANSGMVQFKNLFTGQETRDYQRAVTSQKCVRAGGKHNDLDNVGFTARHLTFFEMLGNFSFGDYFKEQAIPYAWEMVTKELDIPKEKLLVTVYHTDDEAANLWKKVAGLSDDRIIRIANDDNFWRMGPTGPNGPSSEIFYDHGDHIPGGPPGSPDEDGDRFIEIWNLVFMQYETFEDGTSRELPRKSIDTGMGLERIASLLQGTNNVFETDLMMALVEASAHATNTGLDADIIQYHRVMADHLRSTAFLIAEGVLPSNEGRGYVLRRIMRRAMRYGHLLGAKDPVMYKLVPELVRQMGNAYPELHDRQAAISDTLYHEEVRFRDTLGRGLKLLDAETSDLAEGDKLAGDTAFKLYDTFGFPLDLTQDALRTRGIGVDTDGFNAAMAEQKAQARAARNVGGAAADDPIWLDLADELGTSEFLGYDTETAQGQCLAIVHDGKAMDATSDEAQIIANQSPFYAESGGQVGDHGVITWNGGRARVTDTQNRVGLIVHSITVEEGELRKGDALQLDVDHARRKKIRANHSSTHLVNEALRRVLGEHVAQKGSLNAEDRLRFDFSHQNALSDDEIAAVNHEVNHYIRQNTRVTTRIMTPDEARSLGAQALFGEKYGEEVRVVSMGHDGTSGKGADGETYSIELCGGTHVTRTGDIGALVVTADSASAAGVRRIEALTGQAALDYLNARDAVIGELSSTLKAKPEEIAERLKQIQEQSRKQAAEIADLKRQLATGGGGASGEDNIEAINNHQFIAKRLDGLGGKDLPPIMDELRAKIENGVIVLFAVDDGRVAAAVGIVGDLDHSAKDLIQLVTPEIGGKGGGGRPDMAQGGGSNADGIEAAIQAVRMKLSA